MKNTAAGQKACFLRCHAQKHIHVHVLSSYNRSNCQNNKNEFFLSAWLTVMLLCKKCCFMLNFPAKKKLISHCTLQLLQSKFAYTCSRALLEASRQLASRIPLFRIVLYFCVENRNLWRRVFTFLTVRTFNYYPVSTRCTSNRSC